MADAEMLRGKTVVLTGASSGLGAAMALVFANAGAQLVLFATSKERLQVVADQCIEAGTRAVAVPGDVTDAEDCRRLCAEAERHFGGIDYLVCNAGISMWARFDEVEDLAVFQRLVDVNYMGVVHCVHAALPQLKKSRGLIVAISSIQGKVPVPLHSGYVASKHALQGFCDALRVELMDAGVEVMVVLPHWLRGTNLRQSALGCDGQALGQTSRKHSSESITVEDASSAILRAMEKRQRQLVIPWKLKLLAMVYALKPQWAEAVIRRALNKQDHGE